MKIFYFIIITSILLVACETKNAKGESFETKNEVVFNESFAQKVSATDTIDAIIRGEVNSVCQMKGCWMTMKSADGDSEFFVQFKDGSFSAPKDLLGVTVSMKGRAFIEKTSVEELKFYAEEEGQPQEEIDAITEPLEELKFVASGLTWE